MDNNNGYAEVVPRKMCSQEILEMIDRLDPQERTQLLAQLSPGVMGISGGMNWVSHGIVPQMNVKSAEDVTRSLEKIPPEAIGEFLKAIGMYIAQNRQS